MPVPSGDVMIHVGFGNFVAIDRVLAIVLSNAAPIQRLIREGKRHGKIIDCTSGRRTKAAVFMDSGEILLVAITPESLAGRVAAMRSGRIASAQAD